MKNFTKQKWYSFHVFAERKFSLYSWVFNILLTFVFPQNDQSSILSFSGSDSVLKHSKYDYCDVI